ncbi:MAG: CRISPR-associated RAMP protein Csx7 [Cyanobacteria bacterium P01_D01_bin.14]
MFHIFKNRLELEGTLTTVTALRISQGRSNEPTDPDLPVVKDFLGQPLIPGSSFKGALRSRLESFLRGINPTLANDPAELVSREFSEQVKVIKANAEDDAALSEALDGITDAASKVFGSPWQASKLQVRDLTVKKDTWFGQYQERDGVSIDRDTETAADGRLYDFQVVPAGVQFDFKAIFENADPITFDDPTTGEPDTSYWELGLLSLGLRQLQLQQIPLGGGNSRGLGVVQLDIDRVMWIDPEDDPAALLKYMQDLSNGDLSDYERSMEFFEAVRNDWTLALMSYLARATPASETAPVEA